MRWRLSARCESPQFRRSPCRICVPPFAYCDQRQSSRLWLSYPWGLASAQTQPSFRLWIACCCAHSLSNDPTAWPFLRRRFRAQRADPHLGRILSGNRSGSAGRTCVRQPSPFRREPRASICHRQVKRSLRLVDQHHVGPPVIHRAGARSDVQPLQRLPARGRATDGRRFVPPTVTGAVSAGTETRRERPGGRVRT